MPQSLAKIYLYLVFSTKDRAPLLGETVRDPLHRYAVAVLDGLGCHALLIDSVEDHLHILLELARTVAVSKVVEEGKKSSSKWLEAQAGIRPDFAWQSGYGVFSVSASNVAAVRDYVLKQREHHRKRSYQDELRALLERHGVDFDERYLWEQGALTGLLGETVTHPGRCPGLAYCRPLACYG